ncbi:hypothetical protein [Paenibacillus psychroresistens]|uniref:hypothetical protein n=1 Tax=Paenibacillus psychroresistens TaxID=1778678 RepID=UPI0012DA1AF6|nr:hypothetical protein [Paenibacillus psychroresistens]
MKKLTIVIIGIFVMIIFLISHDNFDHIINQAADASIHAGISMADRILENILGLT